MIASRVANLKLEPVSSRLKGELIHPNRTGGLAMIQFSPDGKRIVAGDYPGGVIAQWDVASGKLLTTLEAGYGYHATMHYYDVAPDWHTVFAWREKRKAERIEQDGKRMLRWTFDSEVRAWSLDDGRLLRTYKRQPASLIRIMRLAPDGRTIYTAEELPGIYERAAKSVAGLWDVKTATARTLEGVDSYGGTFSSDGKSVTFPFRNEDGNTLGLKLLDVATGREKWTLPIADKNASAWVSSFSRDGRLLFGAVTIYERPKQRDKWRTQLKWWDAATGHEVASFACDKGVSVNFGHQSPDGQLLTALDWNGDKRELLLFSVPQKRLLHTVLLCTKTEGQRPIATCSDFSPDGKWLAVITRTFPENERGDDLDARDLPQPRIHLIEAATGTIRETLVAPQAFSNAAAFSPDGRTLATDGLGRVLLWDLSKPPGEK